ncbi:hypothetical protein TSUD_57070 [Trifolium subterraneum]|uniref:Uncharacterized protein n=1 Tax=Trifolium subterraneum TaxID=3900 RepID=A0A2Z6P5Z4_TRISU|nr:hypothetical protein TSUD_57070 [Trifolium subterraneum]
MDGLLHDIFGNVVEEDESSKGPNEEANKFYNLINEAKQELYPGCEGFSTLSFIIRLYLLKCLHGSKAKGQPRERVVSKDELRAKEQPMKRMVDEDESRTRQESARKKSKRTVVCPSMLIDDFLKENGKDVEKEIEKLIEDEGDIVMEEQEQEENVDCEEAAETNEFRNFLGTIARNSDFCPSIYTNFKELLKEEAKKDHIGRKERIWSFVQSYYIIPDEGEKAVFYSINLAWRRYKFDIKKDHFLKYTSMKQRLKNRPEGISEDHFKKLLIYWKDSKVQAISQKNAVNKSKQKFRHRVGPRNFARIHAKVREEKDREVTQAEVFIETRQSRKGKEVDGETQVAIDKLQESIEQSTETAKQTFHLLFGKERSGRMRCHGRTVTPSSLRKKEEISLVKKQYDGKIADMSMKMGAMEVSNENYHYQDDDLQGDQEDDDPNDHEHDEYDDQH